MQCNNIGQEEGGQVFLLLRQEGHVLRLCSTGTSAATTDSAVSSHPSEKVHR